MKRVMVVDDDKDFLKEIVEVVKSSGYDVLAFSSGDEALDVVMKQKVDIIFLDLKMEGASGFKVANEIRRTPKTSDIPIVAMTGVYTEEAHRLPIKACGFVKNLIKPIKPLDVISTIEDVLA